MYKWNIDIYLKSGVKLECACQSKENNTLDVANKLFSGKQMTEFVGMDRRTEKGNTYVQVGDVAAFDIYT